MLPTERSLPKFENPPVVETVLAVEFEPLAGWGIPLFGLYWELIREEYPTHESGPALPPSGMTGGPQFPGVFIRAGSGSPFDARCMFHHAKGDRLIQIQGDRFIHNWRRTGAGGYLGYDRIRQIFESEWNRFCEFIGQQGIQPPVLRSCEVTYLNHLVRGEGWEKFSEMNALLRYWTKEPTGFLPAPDHTAMNMQYQIPDNKGSLVVQLQPSIRMTDGKEIVQLNLTARGLPATSDILGILSWMDLGHEWIVRGFDDITPDGLHKIWKKMEEPR